MGARRYGISLLVFLTDSSRVSAAIELLKNRLKLSKRDIKNVKFEKGSS